MAQTKRRRRSKHRGTAAGTVEARGRTGRRPAAGERGSTGRDAGRQRREARLNQPPTWRGAAQRAALAAGIFAIAVTILTRKATVIPLAAFMLAVYIPMGYYTELFLYRRRQRNRERDSAKSRRAD